MYTIIETTQRLQLGILLVQRMILKPPWQCLGYLVSGESPHRHRKDILGSSSVRCLVSGTKRKIIMNTKILRPLCSVSSCRSRNIKSTHAYKPKAPTRPSAASGRGKMVDGTATQNKFVATAQPIPISLWRQWKNLFRVRGRHRSLSRGVERGK
jgi:hypothetical protein